MKHNAKKLRVRAEISVILPTFYDQVPAQVFAGADVVAYRMRALAMAHINASGVVGLLKEVLETRDVTHVLIDRVLSTLQQCVIVCENHGKPTVPLDLLDVFTCDSIVNSLLRVYPSRIAGRTVQELVSANLLVALCTAVTAPLVASTLFSRFVALLQYDFPVRASCKFEIQTPNFERHDFVRGLYFAKLLRVTRRHADPVDRACGMARRSCAHTSRACCTGSLCATLARPLSSPFSRPRRP